MWRQLRVSTEACVVSWHSGSFFPEALGGKWLGVGIENKELYIFIEIIIAVLYRIEAEIVVVGV